MGKVYAIVNQKGGTGKTTTSVNLASALASKGKSVLAIDFDPQGNLTYSFGIEDFSYTIADVLNGTVSLDEVLISSEGVQVAPANISLADLELSLVNEIGREFFLKNLLNEWGKAEYVIIDCPPSLSILSINALFASDEVIVPMQLEVMSLQGLNQIQATVRKINKSYKRDIKIKGILPVMVDKRRNLDKEVESFINENYEIPLFNTRIRTNVRASEAPSFGKSVIEYAPNSTSANDYSNFANELLNTY